MLIDELAGIAGHRTEKPGALQECPSAKEFLLMENTPSPFHDRPVSGQPSTVYDQAESIGYMSSERIVDRSTRSPEMSNNPKSSTTLGIFPAPPTPLDHFEKWFPKSPMEVAMPITEAPELFVDKRLPHPPYHVFDHSQKRLLVILVSYVGILSPLSSSIYFPAITAISRECKVSPESVLLTVTVYMVVQAIAPFLWMPICSTLGRRPILIGSLLVFQAATVSLMFLRNFVVLVILRGVQAFGTAALTAICASIIGDISTGKERSRFLGIFGGTLMFTFIAPTIGGILTSYEGFHSIFYFLGAFGLTALLLVVLVLPETLRSIAGDGSIRLSRAQQPMLHMVKRSKDTVREPDRNSFSASLTFLSASSFIEPFYCLKQKDVIITSIVGAATFGISTAIIATTTTMFHGHYAFGYVGLGLIFLPAGVGSLISFFSIGYLIDYDFRVTEAHYREIHGIGLGANLDYRSLPDFPIERARLRNMWWITLIFIGSTSGYGFSFHLSYDYIAVPLILQFLIAGSATAMLQLNGILIEDFYRGNISVTPVVNMVRFLVGALAVAIAQPAMVRIGSGPTFLIMALSVLGLCPISIMQYFLGRPWQAKRNSAWPRQRLVRVPGFFHSTDAMAGSVKRVKFPSRRREDV
ncbi:hypothetical protein HYFRA_00007838 [Hymenoscyphus fraxineus]|uniref:Major facilitator superfamily (MFS) profile domain-containing protein n=1 Tax=Hymenoscyphus fraxineus TaxID=746836 RepID=A0A9N9KP84_9HELO|nr:hypothetical protein HYFRA_00007838 [Hymenoscyphus fraxineus]